MNEHVKIDIHFQDFDGNYYAEISNTNLSKEEVKIISLQLEDAGYEVSTEIDIIATKSADETELFLVESDVIHILNNLDLMYNLKEQGLG